MHDTLAYQKIIWTNIEIWTFAVTVTTSVCYLHKSDKTFQPVCGVLLLPSTKLGCKRITGSEAIGEAKPEIKSQLGKLFLHFLVFDEGLILPECYPVVMFAPRGLLVKLRRGKP